MNRTIYIAIFFFLFLYSQAFAQEYNYRVEERISTNIGAIEDLDFNGSNFAVLTNNEVYSVNQNGEVTDRIAAQGIHGISFAQSNKLLTLNTNDFPKYDSQPGETEVMKFLAGYNSELYSCRLILKNNQMSYSSMIVRKGKENIYFQYIVGIPAGLYSDGTILWYLYNKSIDDQDGMLRKYNIKTGELISEEPVPVKKPKGLSVGADGSVYTYEPYSSSIIKLSVNR